MDIYTYNPTLPNSCKVIVHINRMHFGMLGCLLKTWHRLCSLPPGAEQAQGAIYWHSELSSHCYQINENPFGPDDFHSTFYMLFLH